MKSNNASNKKSTLLGEENFLVSNEIDGHKKCASNPNWQAKVRQTLQMYDLFESDERGVWALA